jgi:hypothetical protein
MALPTLRRVRFHATCYNPELHGAPSCIKATGRAQATLQIFSMLVPPGEPMGSPQVMA